MAVNSGNKIFDTCLVLVKGGFNLNQLAKIAMGHILNEEKKIVGVLKSGDKIGHEGMVQILHDIFLVYNHVYYTLTGQFNLFRHLQGEIFVAPALYLPNI